MAEQNKPSISYEEKIYRRYITFLKRHVKEMEKTSNWDMVFKILKKIYIHPDYTLDDFGGLKLFARHRSTPCYKECEERMLDYFKGELCRPLVKDEAHLRPPYIAPHQVLVVEMNPQSLWQAFLLFNTSHFIGLRQSEHFEKWNIVFSEKDVESVMVDETLDYEKIKSLIFPPKFLQEEEVDHWNEDEINYIEYCYWSDSEGLVKEKVIVIYDYLIQIAHFIPIHDHVLYEYHSPTTQEK